MDETTPWWILTFFKFYLSSIRKRVSLRFFLICAWTYSYKVSALETPSESSCWYKNAPCGPKHHLKEHPRDDAGFRLRVLGLSLRICSLVSFCWLSLLLGLGYSGNTSNYTWSFHPRDGDAVRRGWISHLSQFSSKFWSLFGKPVATEGGYCWLLLFIVVISILLWTRRGWWSSSNIRTGSTPETWLNVLSVSLSVERKCHARRMRLSCRVYCACQCSKTPKWTYGPNENCTSLSIEHSFCESLWDENASFRTIDVLHGRKEPWMSSKILQEW